MKIKGDKERSAMDGFYIHKETIMAATYGYLEYFMDVAAENIVELAKTGSKISNETLEFAMKQQERKDGD